MFRGLTAYGRRSFHVWQKAAFGPRLFLQEDAEDKDTQRTNADEDAQHKAHRAVTQLDRVAACVQRKA